MADIHVELCATAAHLDVCGECADAIGKIVKEEIIALTQRDPVPAPEVASEEKAKQFDGDGIELSGLITSHADVPNASDHPVEYGERCGICIARKRKAHPGAAAGSPDAVLQALERL